MTNVAIHLFAVNKSTINNYKKATRLLISSKRLFHHLHWHFLNRNPKQLGGHLNLSLLLRIGRTHLITRSKGLCSGDENLGYGSQTLGFQCMGLRAQNENSATAYEKQRNHNQNFAVDNQLLGSNREIFGSREGSLYMWS